MVGSMLPGTIVVAVFAVAHAERLNTPSSFMLVGGVSATSEMCMTGLENVVVVVVVVVVAVAVAVSAVLRMHYSRATTFGSRCFNKSVIFRFVSCFRLLYSCPMLEVLSARTGESIAVFEDVGFAEGSVKALKQRLAQKIGISR